MISPALVLKVSGLHMNQSVEIFYLVIRLLLNMPHPNIFA